MMYSVETKKEYKIEDNYKSNLSLNLCFPRKSDGTRKGVYMACAYRGRIFWEKKKAEAALETYLSLCNSNDERFTDPKLYVNIYPELKNRDAWVIKEE